MSRPRLSLTMMVGVLAATLTLIAADPTTSSQLEQLLRMSGRDRVTLQGFERETLDARDVAPALKRIKDHPDLSSLHMLMVLRQRHRKVYESLPPETRARVLISYLKATECGDDWSYLCAQEPLQLRLRGSSVSVDNAAGQALLELPVGVTKPLLINLLDDQQEMFWSGSAKSSESYLNMLRRCDLAYRYICISIGQKPEYARSVRNRDNAIQALKRHLSLGPVGPLAPRSYKERSGFTPGE